VLYCAGEDSERRLLSRRTKLIEWPADLQLATGWRRLGRGGVGAIAIGLCRSSARFVMFDTLARVKPQHSTHGYQEDSAALEELHRLANDVGIAVLILPHQRKKARRKIRTPSPARWV